MKMIATDIIVIAALLVYLFAWWMRSLNKRSLILGLSALVALVVGIVGVFDHRWQDGVGASIAAIFLLVLLINTLRKAEVKKGIPWFSGPLVTLLIAFSFASIYLFPMPDLPSPSGEHAVGSKVFELIDNSRLGVFEAKDDEARRLLVRVWYPAGDVSGLTPRPYFTDEEVDTTAAGIGGMLGAPFLFQYVKHSATNTYTNAPLLELNDQRKFPVVIYSHGYTSFASQNSALMEELASHGYVVYSVQHTYDSSPTVFPNGDIAPTSLSINDDMAAMLAPSEMVKKSYSGITLTERYEGKVGQEQEAIKAGARIQTVSADVWLKDRIFVLDELERGAVPEKIKAIASASDFTQTGQMGMSFGGSTSGGVCMIDDRCAAAINLDGGDFHGTPFEKNMPVPMLMMYSDFNNAAAMFEQDGTLRRGHNDFSYERHEAAGLRNDVYRAQVHGGQHLGFSDFTLFVRSPVSELLFGTDNMVQIQNDFVLGFLDKHLLNKQNDFPKAAYAKHAASVEKNDISDIRTWWLADHPEDVIERVILETSTGTIELALYPNRAPIAVNNFLAYVDGRHFDGASFYRATNKDSNNSAIDVVQGGLFAEVMAQKEFIKPASTALIFPPIAHEKTSETGIINERGTIAFARLEPGTATSEFFVNIQGNSLLNSDVTIGGRDGFGYTAFGRVLRGMRVLEQIQSQRRDVKSFMAGQILNSPIVIKKAYRVITH